MLAAMFCRLLRYFGDGSALQLTPGMQVCIAQRCEISEYLYDYGDTMQVCCDHIISGSMQKHVSLISHEGARFTIL